ncbi:hypothetical protein QBC37DRAFT_453156 [Rhypophila decipiens]|uniref:Uncharacterized protein n=1 Tax=Rhypophila decipiens TaxID=261697 RepID=A0AAN6XXE7_9PEZI|nr:hypothetical protein QBC37DRAFT_453156 [Rhypophila decipiens]
MNANKTTRAMRSLLDRLLSAFKPSKPRSRHRPGSAENPRLTRFRRPRTKNRRTKNDDQEIETTESSSSDSDSDSDSVSSGYSRPVGYVDDEEYEASHYRSTHTQHDHHTNPSMEVFQREYERTVDHLCESEARKAHPSAVKTVASSQELRRPSSDGSINSRNESQGDDTPSRAPPKQNAASSDAGDEDDEKSEISIEEWVDPDEYAKRVLAKEKCKEKRQTKPQVPKRPNKKNGAPSTKSGIEDKIEEPTMADTPEESDKPDARGSVGSGTPFWLEEIITTYEDDDVIQSPSTKNGVDRNNTKGLSIGLRLFATNLTKGSSRLKQTKRHEQL